MLQGSAAPKLLEASDDTLVLVANACALSDLAALSSTCARLRHACTQRMAAVARLGAAPFNLSFRDVALNVIVNLSYHQLQDTDMVVLSAALASGATRAAAESSQMRMLPAKTAG